MFGKIWGMSRPWQSLGFGGAPAPPWPHAPGVDEGDKEGHGDQQLQGAPVRHGVGHARQDELAQAVDVAGQRGHVRPRVDGHPLHIWKEGESGVCHFPTAGGGAGQAGPSAGRPGQGSGKMHQVGGAVGGGGRPVEVGMGGGDPQELSPPLAPPCAAVLAGASFPSGSLTTQSSLGSSCSPGSGRTSAPGGRSWEEPRLPSALGRRAGCRQTGVGAALSRGPARP